MKRSEVIALRAIIETSVQSLDDETALKAIPLYPHWKVGASYTVGTKVQKNGKLWRCIQSHTSIEGWQPENTPSLWEQINETNKGTLADPIPYEGNMALENGKYYTQNGVTYLCNRDTGNPVHNSLSELVGLYVEVV
jgi:hypothetical protein